MFGSPSAADHEELWGGSRARTELAVPRADPCPVWGEDKTGTGWNSSQQSIPGSLFHPEPAASPFPPGVEEFFPFFRIFGVFPSDKIPPGRAAGGSFFPEELVTRGAEGAALPAPTPGSPLPGAPGMERALCPAGGARGCCHCHSSCAGGTGQRFQASSGLGDSPGVGKRRL